MYVSIAICQRTASTRLATTTIAFAWPSSSGATTRR